MLKTILVSNNKQKDEIISATNLIFVLCYTPHHSNIDVLFIYISKLD